MSSGDSSGSRGRLVGRQRELSMLCAGLEQAARGDGGVYLVTGEAGIGKSALIAELARRARALDLRVLAGRCSEAEGAPAYWPWAQVLRALLEEAGRERLEAELPGACETLTELLPELWGGGRRPRHDGEHAPERRFRLFEAAVRLLRACAEEQPLLVAVDDLQRADRDSLLLLREVGREVQDSRIALVATCRDGEAGSEAARILEEVAAGAHGVSLTGLVPEDVGLLVRATVGLQPAQPVCAALHELTGGNPLFVGEVARLVADDLRDEASALDALARAHPPATVRHAILRRVRRLGPATRQLLRVASVVGREIEIDLLAALTGRGASELLEELGPALESHLLERSDEHPDRLVFAHVLGRDALYTSLPAGEQLRLHRRVADALEALGAARDEDQLERLVHHLLEAGPEGDPLRAMAYATRAGRSARRRLALDRAASHYRKALAALERIPPRDLPDLERRRCELQLALGDALWQTGAADESHRIYLRAADDARALGDARLLARAAIGAVGRDDLPVDLPRETAAALEEAVCAFESEDDPLRARLLSTSALALYHAGRRDAAEARARQALRIVEPLGDAEALFYTLLALHQTLWTPEHLDERLRISEQLLGLAASLESARPGLLARHWRAVDLLELGDLAGAAASIRHFARRAEALRQPFYRWIATAQLAMLDLADGRLGEAEARIQQALALGREAGSRNAPAVFGDQLLHLREHQGRLGELEELVRRLANDSPIPAFRIGPPLVYVDTDQREKARAAFERAAAADFDDIPRDGQWLAFLHCAARVAAYLDDRPRAARLLELLQPFAGRSVVSGSGTVWAGSIHRYLGLLHATLGDHEAAEDAFARAAAEHRRAGARPLLAHTLREHAALELRRGRREEATALAKEALHIYRELGVGPFVAATRELLASERPPTPRSRDSGSFLFDGAAWEIAYGGVRERVGDSKGMRDLAVLLASPHREVYVLDLMTDGQLPTGLATERAGAVGPLAAEGCEAAADDRARAEYRRRLAELREEIEAAARRQDRGAEARLQEERAWLERAALRRARLGSDRAGRARKAVYNRVSGAIRRIEAVHPRCGRHLRHAVRTGYRCAYRPERETEWEVRLPPAPPR